MNIYSLQPTLHPTNIFVAICERVNHQSNFIKFIQCMVLFSEYYIIFSFKIGLFHVNIRIIIYYMIVSITVDATLALLFTNNAYDILDIVYAHSTTVGYPMIFHGIISH